MQLFSKRKNKIYAVIVSILLVIQPLSAIDITSVNGLKLQGGGVHQPSQGVRSFVDNAKDTLPIVNINTPNSEGASHNTYNHFNVDTGGVVLNNNATNVYTQLAGWIEGNPNLRTNNEAKLIINEVVSNNPSLLKGFIEVGGKKADVIVANPNGITLNGAGFINTNKVTLTTGIPYINANTGNIEKFIVKNGTVVVDGDSNILEQAQLDILSRALIVNKKLKANVLNIRTGANEIDANTLNATPITPQSQAPSFSVDVSSLGGMYANVISLQGTEAGVGVNMQGELLSESNLSLDVNGNITLGGQTHAKQITSNSQSLNISGKVLADEKLALTTTNDLNGNGGSLESKEVSLKSIGGNVDLNTKITASDKLAISSNGNLSLKNSINANNSINLQSSGNQTINGDLQSTKIDVKSTNGDIYTNGKIVAQNNINLDAAKNLSLNGELNTKQLVANAKSSDLTANITADDNFSLNTTGNINANGGTVSSKEVAIKSTLGNVDLNTKVTASDKLDITSNGNLSLKNSINAQNSINLQSGGNQTINGDLQSTKIDVKATNGNISINGKVISTDYINLDANGQLLIGGEVSAKDLLNLKARDYLSVNGFIIGSNVNLESSNGNILVSKEATSSKAMNILATNGSIEILGYLSAVEGLNLQSKNSITTSGNINANKIDMLSTLGDIFLGGSLTSKTSSTINSGKDLNINGLVAVSGDLKLDAKNNIDIKNSVKANDIAINSLGYLNVIGGIESAKNLVVNAGDYIQINDNIKAVDVANLKSTNSIVIKKDIKSDQIALESTNSDITVDGKIEALSKIEASSGGKITLNNPLISKDINLTSKDLLYINGYLNAYDAYLKSINGDITVKGGITASNVLDIDAKGLLNFNGDINSDNSLDITASSMNLVNSKVVAKKALNLETTQGDITLDKSLIQSKEDSLNVKSKNKLSLKNASSISAFDTMNIQADSLEVDKSSISSGKKLTIHNNNQPLSSFSNTNNSIVISEDDDVQIAANNITNTDSKVIAGKNIHFKTKDFINTHGLIFAINDVTIDDGMGGRANSIVNKEADIVAFDGNLTLKAKTVTNEGKAPTFVSDGYVATWYETASGNSKDLFPNTYKLFKDGILGTDSKPKAQYYQAYVDLLTALMKGVTPNAQAKALIKDSLINPDGSINQDMINTWSNLSARATQNGISDFDAHLKTLLVSKVSVQVQAKDANNNLLFDALGKPIMTTVQVDLVKADGTIQAEYVDRYVTLWEKAMNGEDIPQSVLDILKSDVKDANGYVISSITSVWSNIRTVAGAGYEIKKTLVADVLKNDGVLAQLVAGKNITIDTEVMKNQYANISSGQNINISSDTSITNNAYGASQRLHEVHKTGCYTCHHASLGFRETFGGIIEAKGDINLTANSLANIVTSTSQMTFNLPRIDEFSDLRANSNPVPKSFVVVRNVKANEIDSSQRAALVDAKVGAINLDYIKEQTQKSFTNKNSLNPNDLNDLTNKSVDTTKQNSIVLDNSSIASKLVKKQPTQLNFGTYTLPIQGEKAYVETIETRPTYTNYGAFLSSDYMMKRLKYSPEHESRMNSNEWVLNSANRSGTTIIGENVNLKIKDSIVLDGGITANNKLNIDTQGNLSSSAELKSKGDMSINAKGELNQTGGGIKAQNLNVYTGKDLNLTGTKVKVDESINLKSDKSINLNAQRQIDSGIRGDISWQNSQDIGTSIEANKNIKLTANDDINLIASNIESKGGSVALKADDEINLKAGENYQEFAYSRTSSSSSMGGLKKKTTTENHHEQHLTHTGSTIKGRDGVDLNAQNNITVEGSTLSTRNGDINIQTQGDVTFKAVQDKKLVEHNSNTKKSFAGINYGKAGSSSTLNQTINQGSISDALGDIDSKAGGITTLEGSKLKAGGNININSKNGIQILSVQDTSDYESESWSKGTGNVIGIANSLLSKEQKESLQKALTVSSLIDAKTVNLQTNTGVIIKGSQIQATTVNFMANFLNLISDKNSESYSSFSDSSGVVTRTIISKGYIKEEAVAAQVNAQQITLNGKTLLEDKLKPENLLKQLSSEYNLNEAQISQVKAQLTNKEWYDKTTTLSKMGMIIVQAVVTVLTAGTGTGFVAGIDATVDAMVNAAINSMITQTLTQLATAAITGNKLELDINTLLTNSLKAAALAGLTAQIDTNLGLNKDNLSYADKATQQILHGFAQKAVYGGSLESILATSAGNVAFDYIGHSVYSNDSQFPQLRDAIPKTVVHSLLGGTLSQLAGGDFSQGAINTAVSHSVAEYMDKELLDKTVKGDISKEEAKAYIKAISSVVSGAAVLATHENVSDKDLKIAQDMGTSVVENNALKGFDAKVEFAKGIYQGGSSKVWEDLKALKIALDNPKETVKALMNLVASPEALATLGEDVVNDLKLKSVNVYNALISDTVYEGEKANKAGRDLGELALTVLEAYSGVKGVTTGVNAAKDVIKAVGTKVDKVINDTVDLNMKFITLNGSSVELASVGSKGNWEKLINTDLKPNTAYALDNGHTYITNASGKVNYVEADLSKITMDRNTYQQSVVGKSGEAADQGGHLIASALGGAGDRINLVPMDKVLNNGAYKKMEADLIKAVSEGKNVSVKIDVGYPDGGGNRPSSFTVNYTIDGGKPIKKEFKQ